MTDPADRPTLTRAALRRWLPLLARRTPALLSAYLVPGHVPARSREATMLGVTSVNRCHACARVHERWGRAVGLPVGDPLGFARQEAAAYAYGQALALDGPRTAVPPADLSGRHRRELEATGILMQIANLGGNRFFPGQPAGAPRQLGSDPAARGYDVAMRVLDRAGLRQARRRTVGDVTGRVLEIGIGTGLNLVAYRPDVTVQGIDPSGPALAIAARRGERLGRPVELITGDAAVLPFADATFDAVVGTFALCSVGDVEAVLGECRRVLRSGGTLRVLEHARSDHPGIAKGQARLAPAWARASGGCRLDHDVQQAIETAGLHILRRRAHATGLLVEIIATRP